LHQRVLAQGGMVVQVFIAATQAVEPLGDQITEFMDDQVGVARVMQGSGHRFR
jgi:hypothetical protein